MSEIYDSNNTEVEHPKWDLPKPQVHGTHPFVHQKNHQALMDYIIPRLNQGKAVRDSEVTRYAEIDKAVSCWMKMSDDDKKRIREKVKSGKPSGILMNLPIAFIHADDMLTYYTQTFAPGKAMFYQQGKPDESKAATQVVNLMNNHAVYTGYYRQLALACWAMEKYNLGGLTHSWEVEFGAKLQRMNGQVQANQEVVWEGNKITSLNVYNTLMDPQVHPSELYKDGEWGATVEIKSFHWIMQRALAGVYSNLGDELYTKTGQRKACRFYKHPPTEAMMNENEDGPTNWVQRLSDNPEYTANNGFELVKVYIRLNPVQFGLVDSKERATRNRYEIWRFTILEGGRIIEATYMNNVHNHIPMYLGLINDDEMGRFTKSVVERLLPMQDLASHTANIHILGSRKKLFGTTYYDKSVIDLSIIPEGEVAARVPTLPGGAGKRIQDAIYHDEGTIDTQQTMEHLSQIMDLTNQLFPTQALPSQIAGIDRAVKDQVSAVQNGVNRRLQKAAILMDCLCFRPMRFGLYFNILQYQKDGQQMSDYRGRSIKVDLSGIGETDLMFVIGMGLKAIDRIATADKLQQVIFALIQTPQAGQQFDLARMLDYWSDMQDIDMDLTQFRIQQPAPTNPPGPGQEGAAVDEQGNAIQPATAPGNLTSPIYS